MWRFLALCGLVKVSWLGKLVSVFWWVDLYFFSLEYNEMSSNELWDVYGFGVAFLYSGSWGFLFIVEVLRCVWGWMGACQGFLVREACVSVLVRGAGFLLSGVK